MIENPTQDSFFESDGQLKIKTIRLIEIASDYNKTHGFNAEYNRMPKMKVSNFQ